MSTLNAFHHARKLLLRQSRSWLMFTGLQINEHAVEKVGCLRSPCSSKGNANPLTRLDAFKPIKNHFRIIS